MSSKKDNVAVAHYINAKRKKKENRSKEEARKKADEGQSSFPPTS
jgi:hypothetical protein